LISFDDYIIINDNAVAEISASGIKYNDSQGEHFILFKECAANYKLENPMSSGRCVGERWAQDNPPNIVFYTAPLTTHIYFPKGNKLHEFFSELSSYKRFYNMQKAILSYGYTTYDCS